MENEILQWVRVVAALVATLALVGAIAYGARRFGMLQGVVQPTRRMKVSESLMLDPRRRLVLVRVDSREHLLLLSPAGDQVVAALDVKEDTP